MQKTQGQFIVFEGVDGSGKSTQRAMYADYLCLHGLIPVSTAEPFGTVGVLIREILAGKHPALNEPEELARLFAASRHDHTRRTIHPALDAGQTILCDRYYPSSLAYQAAGCAPESWAVNVVWRLNRHIPAPTVTLVFDVSEATAVRRIAARSGAVECFDTDGEEAVKARLWVYERLAEYPGVGMVIHIDGEGTPNEVHALVRAALDPIVFEGGA